MNSQFEHYRFEDLEVWKLAMEIVHHVYKILGKLPKSELFILGDQLRRASISIVLNVAEGSGQPTSKSFILYLRRARASVLECVACNKIALQEHFLEEKDMLELNKLLEGEYFKLAALEKSLSNKT